MLCTLDNIYPKLCTVYTPLGIQASNDTRFKGGIFGRDSAIVALDLVAMLPSVARTIIFSLARLIGLAEDPVTGEQLGRIHHEYRCRAINGEVVTAEVDQTMVDLAHHWGLRDDGEILVYSSVDATLHYIRLVAAYQQHYPEDHLLARQVQHRTGVVFSVDQSLEWAVEWVMRRLRESSVGFVEFQRTNPRLHLWESLRDGVTAYLHEDGQPANYQEPVASLDVQGYTYAALLAAARTLANHPHRDQWLHAADRLRQDILARFWMPDRSTFAMALDRADGAIRQVRTLTNMPGELLTAGLFEGLPDGRAYIEAIVQSLFSTDLLTPVGFRTRGRQYANILPYWDYQGAYTSWYVVTNLIAQGLARSGLDHLAQWADSAILHGVNESAVAYEFSFVDTDGSVLYRPGQPSGAGQVIPTTNCPEHDQAWTISAVLRTLHTRHRAISEPDAFTRHILREAAQFLENIPRGRQFRIDLDQGQRLEQAFEARYIHD